MPFENLDQDIVVYVVSDDTYVAEATSGARYLASTSRDCGRDGVFCVSRGGASYQRTRHRVTRRGGCVQRAVRREIIQSGRSYSCHQWHFRLDAAILREQILKGTASLCEGDIGDRAVVHVADESSTRNRSLL